MSGEASLLPASLRLQGIYRPNITSNQLPYGLSYIVDYRLGSRQPGKTGQLRSFASKILRFCYTVRLVRLNCGTLYSSPFTGIPRISNTAVKGT